MRDCEKLVKNMIFIVSSFFLYEFKEKGTLEIYGL